MDLEVSANHSFDMTHYLFALRDHNTRQGWKVEDPSLVLIRLQPQNS